MDQDIKCFKMLGDKTRLRIMVLLIDRRLCVSHIYEGLNLEQSNTSKQLNLLLNADMVSVIKNKKRSFYFISPTLIDKYPLVYATLKEFRNSEIYLNDALYMNDIHQCECENECFCIV